MRHPSWDVLSKLITEFVAKYGGVIHDYEAGQSWDPGQFVCRLVYGSEWMKDPRFQKDKNRGEDEPVPRDAIARLREVMVNGLPEWTKDNEPTDE